MAMSTGLSLNSNFGFQPNYNSSPAGSGISGAYKSALEQNAGDYDTIMGGYKDLLNSNINPKIFNFTSLSPQFRNYMGDRQYQSSPGYEDTINRLSEFSKTGGYSEADQQALRARGVAPIRSAYATALKELNRQKSLQGGYAPNQGAALSKFAREKGYLMSDKISDINAGIAERVAQNKLSSLSALAPLQAQEQARRNEWEDRNYRDRMGVDEYNTNLINEFNRMNQEEQDKINQLNANEEQRYLDNKTRALQGMLSIYSAHPGLVDTFGSQVLNDRNQTLNNIGQRGNQGFGLISQLQRGGYRG